MKSKTFQTSDLCLASVLCYQGFKILEVDKSNPSRARFIFTHSPELDQVISDLWDRELSVEPSIFFSIIKNLKTRIHNN